MITISLVNQKGGSGKSTLAECLAVASYLDGKATAIIDLDPQGSAYRWYKRRQAEDPVVLSATPANCEDEWQRLKEAGAELIIFDTPARLNEQTGKAIELSDLVVIPSKATLKDLERVGASYDMVLKTSETKTLVVLNQVRAQGDRSEQAIEYLKSKEFAVCPYSLGQRVAYEDADTSGQSPQETEPKGKAAEEVKNVYKFINSLVNKITKEQKNGKESITRKRA